MYQTSITGPRRYGKWVNLFIGAVLVILWAAGQVTLEGLIHVAIATAALLLVSQLPRLVRLLRR